MDGNLKRKTRNGNKKQKLNDDLLDIAFQNKYKDDMALLKENALTYFLESMKDDIQQCILKNLTPKGFKFSYFDIGIKNNFDNLAREIPYIQECLEQYIKTNFNPNEVDVSIFYCKDCHVAVNVVF